MSNQPVSPLILVVDDDAVTNRIIRDLLVRSGYRVTCAASAHGALLAVRDQQPDLVLLDVNLPDGKGPEVCRRILAEPEALPTPVLFISGDADVASKIKCFKAGGVDYIPKPLAAEEVLARVGTHLRLKQAYQALAELQANRIRSLAGAQGTIMPAPSDLPEARYHVFLRQVLAAGGDFYDVIPIGDGLVDYIVADASGHDLSTSFWTATLKTLLNEYATPAMEPRDVLHAINHALCRILPTGIYFTLIYARLNRRSGKLLLANAGHPPALILDRAADQSTFVSQEGDVLGSFSDVCFGTEELRVSRGDRFFLYSDGLIESIGMRQIGQDKLSSSCVGRQETSLEEMVETLVQGAGASVPTVDDVLLMGVEV